MTAPEYVDRTLAPDAEFLAEMAELDRLKVADEDTVERVARAIWDAEEMPADKWTSDSPGWAYERQKCHHLARAAINALKPAPGTDSSGQAVQRGALERQARAAKARLSQLPEAYR